ncbi:MAG: hypothetical protein EXR83_10870 [Gammaproteobacteria bacterium]|nr:hypothetical protein [Gammaproteobacteria bacterium]
MRVAGTANTAAAISLRKWVCPERASKAKCAPPQCCHSRAAVASAAQRCGPPGGGTGGRDPASGVRPPHCCQLRACRTPGARPPDARICPGGRGLDAAQRAAYIAAELPPGASRLLSDVDILVPEASLDLVATLLLDCDWHSPPHAEYDDHYYRAWMHELPPLQHRLRATVLDVHHNILPRTSPRCPDAAQLLARRVPLPGGLLMLAPADAVLHRVLHGFGGGELTNCLRDVLAVHELGQAFGQRLGEPFWLDLLLRAQAPPAVRPPATGAASSGAKFWHRAAARFQTQAPTQRPSVGAACADPGAGGGRFLARTTARPPHAARPKSAPAPLTPAENALAAAAAPFELQAGTAAGGARAAPAKSCPAGRAGEAAENRREPARLIRTAVPKTRQIALDDLQQAAQLGRQIGPEAATFQTIRGTQTVVLHRLADFIEHDAVGPEAAREFGFHQGEHPL